MRIGIQGSNEHNLDVTQHRFCLSYLWL